MPNNCSIFVKSLKRLLKSNYAFQNEKKVHMKQREENYNNRFIKSEKANE